MWSCIHSVPVPTDIRLPQGKSFMMFASNHIIPKKEKSHKNIPGTFIMYDKCSFNKLHSDIRY